jgi:MFS family permease
LLALAAFYVPLTTIMDVDSSLLGKFTLTLPLLLLFIARALDGLTGGSVSVANAYVADISAPDQLKANLGKLSASANAGEVLGPTLAAVLVGTALGYELPVLAAAAMCFVTVLLIWFRLPDSQPRVAVVSEAVPGAISVSTGRNGSRCDRVPSMASVMTICRLPRVLPLLSASFLVNLAFSIFYIAMPVYVAQELSWSPQKMALFFAIMSLVMIFVEGPVLRRVSAVCSDVVLISIGGLVLGLGFLLLDTRLDSTIFAAAVLIAIGNGLMWPLIVALLSAKAGDQQGEVQGLAGSSGAIASVIGLLLGGMTYSSLQGGLFFVAAVLALGVTLLALFARRSAK